jgi:uncharacterized protein
MNQLLIATRKILITGGTGFIGRYLCQALLRDGYTIWVLSRNKENAKKLLGFSTHLEGLTLIDNLDEIAGLNFYAVINLAGQSLVSNRWSKKSKHLFRQSRIDFTHKLYDFFSHEVHFPQVLINASAVGIYGNCGDRLISEKEEVGQDFAATLCRDWEAAAKRFELKGARVSLIRMGIVLDAKGGALGRMLPAFRFGLGGRLGTGGQYMSWIHRHDLVRLIEFILIHEQVSGPINAVAPEPITNRYFTRLLGQILGRPTPLPMPRFFLHLLLGEVADELLLSSQRAMPAVAMSLGFQFTYPRLEQALKSILKK